MEPRILQRDAFAEVGYALETTAEGGANQREIPKFWEKYLQDRLHAALECQPTAVSGVEYGVCFPQDVTTGRFTYCIGLEIGQPAQADPQLFIGHIPAATYAVFTTPPADRASFSTTIQRTWQYIYEQWFPASGYEFAAGCADFELYDERCFGNKDIVMDIYVPVASRG